jgi:hypothetical protein
MLRKFVSSRLTYVKGEAHNIGITVGRGAGGGAGANQQPTKEKHNPLLKMKVVAVSITTII